MVEKGNEVVAYNRHKKGFKCPKEYKGVQIIDIPTIERKNTDAVVYSFIATIRALFGKYDVIHYHAIGPSFFLIIPHILGEKTVVTVHGLNYKTPKWKGFGAEIYSIRRANSCKICRRNNRSFKRTKEYFQKNIIMRQTIFKWSGRTTKRKSGRNY